METNTAMKQAIQDAHPSKDHAMKQAQADKGKGNTVKLTAEQLGEKDGKDLFTILKTHEDNRRTMAFKRAKQLTADTLVKWFDGCKKGIQAAGYPERVAKTYASELKTLIIAAKLAKPVLMVMPKILDDNTVVNEKREVTVQELEKAPTYKKAIELARGMIKNTGETIPGQNRKSTAHGGRGPLKWKFSRFMEELETLGQHIDVATQGIKLLEFAIVQLTKYYGAHDDLKGDLTALAADAAGFATTLAELGKKAAEKAAIELAVKQVGVSQADAAVSATLEAAKPKAAKVPTPAQAGDTPAVSGVSEELTDEQLEVIDEELETELTGTE